LFSAISAQSASKAGRDSGLAAQIPADSSPLLWQSRTHR
jgi:hypothetical protein